MTITNFCKKYSWDITLCRQEFVSSGTFVMPTDVIDNQILVVTTGGGGAGLMVKHKHCELDEEVIGSGGGGSGACYTLMNLKERTTASILVGAGASSVYAYRYKYAFALSSSPGGTSSFTGAKSCKGGEGVTIIKKLEYGPAMITGGKGVHGGGDGGEITNNDTKYSHIFKCIGGSGNYGNSCQFGDSLPGSGAGGGEMSDTRNWSGGSGRVIIYYYKKNQLNPLEYYHGDYFSDTRYALLDSDNIVQNIIVGPNNWISSGVGGTWIRLSPLLATVPYIHISATDLQSIDKNQIWRRNVGIGDQYDANTETFISSSLNIDNRWNIEQASRLKHLLNQ